jgi:hypothetical protein
LQQRLREILDVILRTVEAFGASHAELFSDAPLVVRALTPLAEGADRLFATAALDAGLALCCPMPFPQSEFERDFVAPSSSQPGSIDEFTSLLARAARDTQLSRFEMDGDPGRRSAAYAACGQVVVHQSDVLCVVWDGERRQLTGGTEHALDYAARRSVPIVWIDARAPHHWQVVKSPGDIPMPADAPASPTTVAAESELQQVVQAALRLPPPAHGAATEDIRSPGIDGFYRERWPGTGAALGLPWRLFSRGLGYRSRHSPAVPPGDVAQSKPSASADVAQRLHAFLEWPDRLAVAYSDLYRSSFVVTYLLAALAVGMALLPLALGWDVFEPHAVELLFIIAELAMITSILVIVWRGRTRGWHERWLDYRLAAEFIRQVRFVAPLGGSRALPPRPWHSATYGHAGSTWMAWYAQAVQRDIGLPPASLDRPYLIAWLEDALAMIAAQSTYHADTAARSARIEHRLHLLGISLLSITVLAGALHFVAALEPFSSVVNAPMIGSLIFICGFLPALGAALAGIGNQAEFRRVAKRSTAMHEHFNELAVRMRELLDAVTTATPRSRQTSEDATELALRATEHMINEVLDWRVVFIDRPLDPPA